ncbi:putative TonB-dependent outer membrane exported protein [Flavobacterium beibuense]|uniref:Putative TonB-dependent outer membrane exported protein n=2 Tax=Flavobacterium beibuense TaxID=657326 RepID=A0A444WA04_9FLAO|nr:putative TonB-dependent outer membrane exported protein [Flavobacterium beibuense]
MTPVDKGRFCAACQKNVIDFTKASDREIANAIRNNKSLCGRFSSSQLERDLVVPKEKSTVWTAVAAGVLSFVTLGSYKASAQETVKTEQTDSKTDSIPQNDIPEKLIINGTVSDEWGPLPSANVIIKGTARGTQTDIEGNYSIEVQKGDILEFSFIGLESNSVNVINHSRINVTLIGGVSLSQGIIICKEKRSFFGRMFHSIGNIFR